MVHGRGRHQVFDAATNYTSPPQGRIIGDMHEGHGPAPDVIVIGGGIVGVAAAAHLAEDGLRVALIERTELGAGASGRNSGVVQHPFDPVLVELHLETLALYRALDGLEIAATPAGLLSVTRDIDGVRAMTAELVRTHPHLRPSFVSPDDMRRLEPAVAVGVAACRLDIGYPVGPAAATRAYAARAERAGVEIHIGRPAAPWREDGRVVGIVMEDGDRFAAGAVLVAAGPWSPAIVDPTGAWRPIVGRWGVVVPVRLEAPPTHVMEEAEISIEPGTEDDAEAGHAFSLVTADGSSSLGSTFLPAEPDPDALVPSLVHRGSRFVPAIGDAVAGPPRLCARPLSLDGRPLIGQVPGVNGLWIAAGHGPWGISTGAASGRLVADLMCGRVVAPPRELDPTRFGVPAA
jgi:D-hydroxyproline dehydrogenase subunit beta